MTTTVSPEELGTLLKTGGVLLLDVRRRTDYESDPVHITGADWRDPEEVEVWSRGLARDRRVVVYCVKGGSVSRSITAALAEKGIPADYLEGGIAAWKESGRPTVGRRFP
jgi:rhodanese-related sulfurtransferase